MLRIGGAILAAVLALPVAAEPPVSGDTRVLPRHLAAPHAQRMQVQTPAGFRPAWRDDRLNPHRAEGTIDGVRGMRLVWTGTVPRRLIDRATGRDVTQVVALVYPYIDYQRQTRDLGVVEISRRNGQVVKLIRRARP